MKVDIEELKPKITKALMPLNPQKIILFGSYAYGNPNENSDIDILIVKNQYQNKWDEVLKAKKLLKDIKISKDLLLENERFYNEHISEDWINTAWYDANKYGTVLYEKK